MSKTEQDLLKMGRALADSKKSRLVEKAIWTILGIIIVFPVVVKAIIHRDESDFAYFVADNYNQILSGLFIIGVPYLFDMVFGKLPMELVRTWTDSPRIINIKGDNAIVHNRNTNEHELNFSLKCIKESTLLSERIWFRSGAYLFVGCIIAFVGVAIFYSPIFPVTVSIEIKQRMLDYLPRFGALFFLEFVAFFFLKQYRIMLVEFRYYEAIKRKRQDNVHLMEIIEKYKDNLEILKIINENLSYNTPTNIATGETTEILETQKILNNDLDLMAKLTEMVKAVRSK